MTDVVTQWTREIQALEEARYTSVDPRLVESVDRDEQLEALIDAGDLVGALRRLSEIAWPDEVATIKRSVAATLRLAPLFSWLAGATEDEWHAFARVLIEARIRVVMDLDGPLLSALRQRPAELGPVPAAAGSSGSTTGVSAPGLKT